MAPPKQSQYRLDFFHNTGVKYAEVIDFDYFDCIRKVNEPGLLTWQLRGDHYVISQLADDDTVVLMRANPSLDIPWYSEFRSMYLYSEDETDNYSLFRAECPGEMSRLSWRWVFWQDDAADKAKFTQQFGEFILKNVIIYNFTDQATTANGRQQLNGLMTGLTVEAIPAPGGVSTPRGNKIDWLCPWLNCLDTIQQCAATAGGDFDLVYTGTPGSPPAWQFRFYPGQLGTDRSAAVLMTLDRENIAKPRIINDRKGVATVAVVASGTADAARTTQIVTATGYDILTNHRELFVDGRNLETPEALTAAGKAGLDGKQAGVTFSFSILQTRKFVYGRDYFLGDLVQAKHKGLDSKVKITGIHISQGNGKAETIDVETLTVG